MYLVTIERNKLKYVIKKTELLKAFQAAFHDSALLVKDFPDVWMSWRPSSIAVPGAKLTACAFWK